MAAAAASGGAETSGFGGLPTTLLAKDGSSVPTATALAGAEYVGLYFSASWCGPCRKFTPMLGTYLKAHAATKKFVVVHVNRDRSEADFKSYYGGMEVPYAVPWDAAARDDLMSRYPVDGIPTLIILSAATGAVVTADAVESVFSDPTAAGFPYRTLTRGELLDSVPSVVDAAGVSTPFADVRRGEMLGLYFSAHWCGPCQRFTPELAKWYNANAAPGAPHAGKVDIVFVSGDRSASEFASYHATMPWKALPYDRDTYQRLSSAYGVRGIPTLLFVNPADGSVIHEDGRAKVSGNPGGFPWPPAPRDNLMDALGYINNFPVAVLFVDKLTDAAAQVAAVEAFDAVAAEYFVGGKPDPRVRFVLASDEGEEADAAESVRKFLGRSHQRDANGPTAARLTILDVRKRKMALFADGKLGLPTAAEMSAFVKSFVDGKAPTVTIGE